MSPNILLIIGGSGKQFMRINGILLKKGWFRLNFFKVYQNKENIDVGYDQECLRYVFDRIGLLDDQEARSEINLHDSFVIFSVFRLITELDLPKKTFLDDLYKVRSTLDPSVVVSLFPYIGREDVYKMIISETETFPEINELSVDFLILLMEVRPEIVLSSYKEITPGNLVQVFRNSYFDVTVCRGHYNVINKFISFEDFKVYLDQDDEIFISVVDNKIRLFLEVSRKIIWLSNNTCSLRYPQHPIQVGMHLWDNTMQSTHVIETITIGGEKVTNTLSSATVSFLSFPPKDKLFVALSQDYYWR